MPLRTTLGSYHRPTFESRADYVAIRPMKWGNNSVGYVTISADLNKPLDRDALKPPCDDVLAAKLYRTGFIAMVLTEDGKPKLRETALAPLPLEAAKADRTPKPQFQSASGLKIQSAGFGRFTVVDAEGNRVVTDRWLTKSEAEAIVVAA